MAPEDDDAEDVPLGQPLPPDDRLWRHPSEMNSEAGKQQIVLISKASPTLGRTLAIAVLAGLIGAGTTLGVVMGTNVLVRETPGKTAQQIRDVSAQADPDASEIETADKVLPAVARVEATGPKGTLQATAFVFRSDGQLITTADAVDGATSITVYLRDGSRISTPDVQLVGRSIDADVAVLHIPRTDMAVAIQPTRRVTFGDKTVLIDASPVTRGPDIAPGFVANETTQYNREDAAPVYGLIETSTKATVHRQSAGTVVVDSTGTVIGIVTSRAQAPESAAPAAPATTAAPMAPAPARSSRATATSVLGSDVGNTSHFAIPADYVWNVATQLADTDQVIEPWVGIEEGASLSQDEADREGVSGGMKIRLLELDSPATTGDPLKVDDIVIAINDDTVTSYNDWITALRRVKPDSQVNIRVVRNGEIEQKLLKIGGKPEL
jgi:S1-C subfamily serine protease